MEWRSRGMRLRAGSTSAFACAVASVTHASDVGQEDLADGAVVVHAGGDVALVAAERELVRDGLALARHALARRLDLRLRLRDRVRHRRLGGGGERRGVLGLRVQALAVRGAE